ncbi:hypothetical protein U1Q18_004145 [Sarracenia purpurea var. burkii]
MDFSMFSVICLLFLLIAFSTKALMMFHMKEIYTFTRGIDVTAELLGSTPRDKLLTHVSNSYSEFLLYAISFLLFVITFVGDKEFQSVFAKGYVAPHVSVAIWRFNFERRVEDFAWDWLRKIIGDILLALSWGFFLVYSWKINHVIPNINPKEGEWVDW